MRRGKFDEQLSGMSGLLDMPTPHAMVLFNESFASTRGRKGLEIAQQIVCAHLDSGIKVRFVTHPNVLACRLKDTRLDDAPFPASGAKGGGHQDIQAYGEPPSIQLTARTSARTSSTRSLATAPASALGRCSRNGAAAPEKGFVMQESYVLRATIATLRPSIST